VSALGVRVEMILLTKHLHDRVRTVLGGYERNDRVSIIGNGRNFCSSPRPDPLRGRPSPLPD